MLEKPCETIMDFLLSYAERWEILGVDLTIQIFQNSRTIYVNPSTDTLKESEAIDSLIRFIVHAQTAGSFDSAANAAKTANMIMLVARGVVYDWCMHNGMYSIVDKAAEMMGLMRYLVVGESGFSA